MNSRHCSFLARQLEAVAPADLTAEQREALTLVLTRGNEVDEVRKARQRLAPPALRGPRNTMVTAWASLSGVLSALASVPAKVAPTGEEATKLSSVLFPEGVVFTTYDAGALWAASRVLERIEEEGLRARLDAIVHPSVMQSIERAYAELAAAVGLDGNVTKLPPKRALLEATTRFSLAVAAYARALALKIDETDVDAITRFRDALAPIDPLRVSGRAGSVEEAEEEEDEGDVEEPTPDPNAPFVPASDDPIDNPFITP